MGRKKNYGFGSYGYSDYYDGDYWGGEGDFYTSRFRSYRERMSSWKTSENIIHPSVISEWSDNREVDTLRIDVPGRGKMDIRTTDIFPASVCGDLFRLMYHSDPQIVKPKGDTERQNWFDVLSSLPIYGLSVQTNNSFYWSRVATKAMMESIANETIKNDKQLQQKFADNYDEAMKQLQKKMQEAMNKGNGGDLSDGAFKGMGQAQSEMSSKQEFLRQLGIDPAKKAGKHDAELEMLDKRAHLMEAFQFNAKKAVQFLQNTTKFFNSSTGRPKAVHDDILSCSDFHDIITPEGLLFNFQIHEVDVVTTKRSAKVDIYIDRSGSMSSPLPGTRSSRNTFTILDACSIFAFKLQNMGIVDKVYVFDNRVHEIAPHDILSISTGGGTSFDNVVSHYRRRRENGSRNPAFVLTDGYDDTSHLHKDVSWMFIEGGPGSTMRDLYSQDQMRIWTDGEMVKISEWEDGAGRRR